MLSTYCDEVVEDTTYAMHFGDDSMADSESREFGSCLEGGLVAVADEVAAAS